MNDHMSAFGRKLLGHLGVDEDAAWRAETGRDRKGWRPAGVSMTPGWPCAGRSSPTCERLVGSETETGTRW